MRQGAIAALRRCARARGSVSRVLCARLGDELAVAWFDLGAVTVHQGGRGHSWSDLP